MPTSERANEKAAEKAEQKASAGKDSMDPADREQKVAGDATVASTQVQADVHVTEGVSPRFSTKPSDVPVDSRTGKPFSERQTEGLKGAYGRELLDADVVVQGIDPKAIPAEVAPGVSPDPGGDKLLAAAQAKAPSLTREFVDRMGISEVQLAQIARGEIPPPPTPGPVYTADMYMTPGGFQQTPPGVKPEDVGGNAVAR